jgi:hypothetical protein
MQRSIQIVQNCLLGCTAVYIPEDNSEHHTRRHENFKSHEAFKDTKNYIQFVDILPASKYSKSDISSNNNSSNIVMMEPLLNSNNICDSSWFLNCLNYA